MRLAGFVGTSIFLARIAARPWMDQGDEGAQAWGWGELVRGDGGELLHGNGVARKLEVCGLELGELPHLEYCKGGFRVRCLKFSGGSHLGLIRITPNDPKPNFILEWRFERSSQT